jgi:lipid-A-disaccharide synthase
MQAEGFETLFPLSDVAVMGLAAIVPALPRLTQRVYAAVDAIVAAKPDALVIIDSPEFTHPIAARVRRRRPDIPIVDYVSPSVWAWRPGRARAMRGYVDHVLALLPFEPEAHARLGGPPCTYVGHPLIERHAWIERRDSRAFRASIGVEPETPLLIVLPGSRRSEVTRLIGPFEEAIRALAARGLVPRVVIPVVPHVRPLVETAVSSWPVLPTLIEGEEAKWSAFRAADAALAASGTVTLELGLAGTPMVVGYRIDPVTAAIVRPLITAPSMVLTNLVLGQNVVPEFRQDDCNGETLAHHLAPLLADTPERAAQKRALADIPARLALPSGTPSAAAARIVLDLARLGRPS